MGSRKRNKASELKELNKNKVFAKLNNCPTSPRKMRLVADQVRGKKVEKALSILKFSQKQPSLRLEKLLLSAINNWQQKNPDSDIEKENSVVPLKGAMEIKYEPSNDDQSNEIWGYVQLIDEEEESEGESEEESEEDSEEESEGMVTDEENSQYSFECNNSVNHDENIEGTYKARKKHRKT